MDIRTVTTNGSLYIHKEDVITLLSAIGETENLDTSIRFTELIRNLKRMK